MCDDEPCTILIRFKIDSNVEEFEIELVKVNEDIKDTAVTEEVEATTKVVEEAVKEAATGVATEIAKGRIDSISKVRVLTEIFGSDFNLLSDLFVK